MSECHLISLSMRDLLWAIDSFVSDEQKDHKRSHIDHAFSVTKTTTTKAYSWLVEAALHAASSPFSNFFIIAIIVLIIIPSAFKKAIDQCPFLPSSGTWSAQHSQLHGKCKVWNSNHVIVVTTMMTMTTMRTTTSPISTIFW